MSSSGNQKPRPAGHLAYRKTLSLSSHLTSDDDDDAAAVDSVCFEDDDHKKSSTNQDPERIEIVVAPSFVPPPTNNHCDNSVSANHSNHRRISVPNSESLPIISPSATTNIWNDDLIESSTPRRAQYRVVFEIIKARTITNQETRQRFVNYTILMKRVPGLETEPAIIERRYSSFRNFYNAIRRRYPAAFRDVVFPPKIFIGNFSAEVIAERSLGFQRFLTHCLSVPEVRRSREFAAFLYYPEIKEAKNCLKSIRLEEASAIFENVYNIQNKLAIQNGRPDRQLIHTLCCLIGCLNGLDNTAEAKRMARRTFELLFENPTVVSSETTASSAGNGGPVEVIDLYESSPLVLPLILLSLRLDWFSGMPKIMLEGKREEICRKRSLARNYDAHPTLLERILRKDFSPII